MGDDKSKTDISKSKMDVGNRSALGVKSGMLKSQAQIAGKSLSRMKVRRPSFGFSGVPGIRPVERTSNVSSLIYLTVKSTRRTYDIVIYIFTSMIKEKDICLFVNLLVLNKLQNCWTGLNEIRHIDSSSPGKGIG